MKRNKRKKRRERIRINRQYRTAERREQLKVMEVELAMEEIFVVKKQPVLDESLWYLARDLARDIECPRCKEPVWNSWAFRSLEARCPRCRATVISENLIVHYHQKYVTDGVTPVKF